jgi:hypothetical protein
MLLNNFLKHANYTLIYHYYNLKDLLRGRKEFFKVKFMVNIEDPPTAELACEVSRDPLLQEYDPVLFPSTFLASFTYL